MSFIQKLLMHFAFWLAVFWHNLGTSDGVAGRSGAVAEAAFPFAVSSARRGVTN